MLGNIVCREAGISQEHMQRAKCLTHQQQYKLCRIRLLGVQRGLEKKREDKQSKVQTKLNENTQYFELLCDSLKVAVDEKHMPYLTMKHFAEVKSPLLKTFILVRNPVFWLASKLPDTGKLEAVTGEVNLISIAYHSRAMPLHSEQEATGGAASPSADSDNVIDRPTIYDNSN